MTTIRLPRVAVSRDLATSLIEGISLKLGEEIIIDGRGLVVNNESFAFQLAEDLSGLHPKAVKVVGGSPKWHKNLQEAARQFSLGIELQPKSVA
jgi:hypothetical protein